MSRYVVVIFTRNEFVVGVRVPVEQVFETNSFVMAKNVAYNETMWESNEKSVVVDLIDAKISEIFVGSFV